MKWHFPTAAALSMLLAIPVSAEPGFYIGGLIGGVWNSDQDFSAGGDKFSLSSDFGGDFSLMGGYNFGMVGDYGSARAELQFSGRSSDVDNFKVKGLDTDESGGRLEESAVFLNGYYDFEMENPAWVPYLGAGVGYGNLNYDKASIDGIKVLNGSDDVWGYQLIAGVGYDFSPKTRVFADYRFRQWQDVDIKTQFGDKASIGNSSSSINLGVMYTF